MAGARSRADPELGLLMDNGGPTFTQPPQAGSPALGAGSATLYAPPPPSADTLSAARLVPCLLYRCDRGRPARIGLHALSFAVGP